MGLGLLRRGDFVKFDIEISPYCPHARVLEGMEQISQNIDRSPMKPPSSVAVTMGATWVPNQPKAAISRGQCSQIRSFLVLSPRARPVRLRYVGYSCILKLPLHALSLHERCGAGRGGAKLPNEQLRQRDRTTSAAGGGNARAAS